MRSFLLGLRFLFVAGLLVFFSVQSLEHLSLLTSFRIKLELLAQEVDCRLQAGCRVVFETFDLIRVVILVFEFGK